MTEQFGTFPFGRPNSVRPMRKPAGTARALVVGVYPSAFHVAWTPPLEHDPRPAVERSRAFISSLAVDVEPVVFWDGVTPSPADLLAQWRLDVQFDDDRHGSVRVGNNGPSGAGLIANSLAPLGLVQDEVAFTDAVPWFFVKHGKGSQGEAITERFAPIAAKLGVDPGSLHRRPRERELVDLARSDQRFESFRTEIIEADAEVIITLGQEALDSIRAVADSAAGVQDRLAPAGYGQRGEATVGSKHFQLLPLVHPGFQRQTTRQEWRDAFARWEASAGSR